MKTLMTTINCKKTNFYKILLLLWQTGLLLSYSASAATTLSAGDIAIIGFNFNNPDEFTFVLLTDITAETQIHFTDKGWTSGGDLRDYEGMMTWTAPSNYFAGTIINPDNMDLLFSTDGDQILAFQGSKDNPTFIYALNSEATDWQSDATSSETSALPASLENGRTAIALEEIDGAKYIGTLVGTQEELLQAISNKDNWQGSDTSNQTLPSESFVVGPPTKIHVIQGKDTSSPRQGQKVLIEGIVIGDFQDSEQLEGFFIQEEAADIDADPQTSEGLFIYDPNGVDVKLGDKVQVIGYVAEYQGLTELKDIRQIEVISVGNSLPNATIIPDLATAQKATLERYEGMRVHFTETLFVTEYFELGRFGEVVLSAGGRLQQPTQITTPGTAANTLQQQNDWRRIVLDDGHLSSFPNPILFGREGQSLDTDHLLRGGDTVRDLVGILDERSGAYRIQTNIGVNFTVANPRPTTPPTVGGTLKIVSFNLDNYFTTIDNGSNGARGADSSIEFTRQQEKLIFALAAIDADILGVTELENNENTTSQDLVNALNTHLDSERYDFIATGTVGHDKIRVAIIYKPLIVTPVGSFAILDQSVDSLFNETHNRPSLAQTFQENASDEKFTLVVNHFRSKNSAGATGADRDQKDGQGAWNATRTAAAKALVRWLTQDPTHSNDPDILMIGDFNAYAQEQPITTIKSAGYTDLIERFNGFQAYSFVFNGQLGYLDHVLANKSLSAQVTGVALWPINADEPNVFDYNDDQKDTGETTSNPPINIASLYQANPFRSADHDPILIGLQLNRKYHDEDLNLETNPNNQGENTDSGTPHLPPTLQIFLSVKGMGTVQLSSDLILPIACEEQCEYTVETASQIQLTPVAKQGFSFAAWGGHSDCVDGQLWMIGNRKCIAYFDKVARLINLSSRAPILGDEQDVVAGFVITGMGTQAVVIRGQALEPQVDPFLTVRKYPSGEFVASNDHWEMDPRAQEIPERLKLLEPTEAGLRLDLPVGAYTATLSSVNSAGIGLISVDTIDKTRPYLTRLINLSTRAVIQGGANDLMMGFVINGQGHQKILIRGLGLEPGVEPTLHLYEYPSGLQITPNQNWQINLQQHDIPEHLRLTKPTEAALLLHLPVGAYTVILHSEDQTGISLMGLNIID